MLISGTALLAAVPLVDLFVRGDAFTPHGEYRIPSLVSASDGSLLAFAMAREHQTDYTPNTVMMRRSADDGASWANATAVLSDVRNHTMFGGAPVTDPARGTTFYLHNQAPMMGGEDFSYVLRDVPGAMAFVGVAAEGSDPRTNPPLHNTRMTIDEAVMAKGVAMHCALAERFLEHGLD